MVGATARIWRFLSADVEVSVIFGPVGEGGIPESIEGRAGLEVAFPLRAHLWLVGRATAGLLYFIDAFSGGSEGYPLSGRLVSGRLTGGVRWPLARHFALGVELGLSAGELTTALVPSGERGPDENSVMFALDFAAIAYFPFL